MQARSARLRAWPSSRRLSTTTPRFSNVSDDAAASLRVGPAADVATEIGPLIDPPGEVLHRALTTLDLGERWLLRPEARSEDETLWTPGIRLDVGPGSWFRAHRVLRPRARDDPRRRPRPRHPDPERQRLRAHCRAAVARSRRDRPMDRTGRGRQPLRQPRHHWRHRATPTLWRLEAVRRRPDRQGGWPELRQHPRPLAGHRRRRRHGHDRVPAMDERHRTPRARPVRTRCRTKRTPLPSTCPAECWSGADRTWRTASAS